MYLKSKRIIFFKIIFLIFLISGLYRIDEIPGEWFGDISIVHEYVDSILAGQWPFYFSLSPGPIYHYVIAPIIYVIGTSYIDYKLASILIGGFGLFSFFLLSKEIAGIRIALLTMGFSAISFWYLVWSRLGNSQIIIPILSALTVFAALRYLRLRKLGDLVFGIVVSSLGLFTYPQTFLLPLIYFVLLIYGFVCDKAFLKNWKIIFYCLLGFVPATILFVIVVLRQPDMFTSGYIGAKLFGAQQYSLNENISRLIRNVVRIGGMFYFEGDITFRVNVPKSPQLDRVSGIFFLLGLLYLLKKKSLKYIGYILIPIFLLPIPSISPALPLVEIPNSGRTLGMVPFVFLLISFGMRESYSFLQKKKEKSLFGLAFLSILILIAFLNLQKYFLFYPKSLPNNNVPFGKIIAEYIDSFPKDTKVYLTSCCWGEWQQPEPEGIYNTMKNKQYKEIMVIAPTKSCNEVIKRPAIIIFNPYDSERINQFESCFLEIKAGEYRVEGERVFTSLYLP